MLKSRFGVALTKKYGVLKLPYHFWTNDPKINPSTKHLMFAAILLEDREAFAQVAGIAALEASESEGQGSSSAQNLADENYSGVVEDILEEFVNLAPDDTFRQVLEEKLSRTVS